MKFGKHKGKSLRDIATNDPDGARYLDWVVGLELEDLTWDALTTFLPIPWVAKLVDEQIASREFSEPFENGLKPRPWWEK